MGEHIFAVMMDGRSLDALSGLLITALGVFVASRPPAHRVNVLFGLFATGWGLSFFLGNTMTVLGIEVSVIREVLLPTLRVVASLVLLYLSLIFPTVLRKKGHYLILPILYVSAAGVVAFSLGVVENVLTMAMRTTLLASAVLFAFRFAYGGAKGSARTMSQSTLIGAALILDPAIRAGIDLGAHSGRAIVLMPGVLLVAFVWLWTSSRASPPLGRGARNVALLVLGLAFFGALLGSRFGLEASDSGIQGLARTGTVAVFGYAILKHQLFGLDLKVKWSIRRGTIVTVLAGGFFLVKETMEYLLPLEGLVPSLVGAATVGLLVFPAWRLAGRLTEQLLPGVANTAEYRSARRRDMYKAAVESVLSQGAIPLKERKMLARLQDELGLQALEAVDIETVVTYAEKAS